jgi:hypothetical protein
MEAVADFSQVRALDWLKGNLGNPIWRLEHLYWILDEDGKRVKFTLRPAIKILIQTMHLRNVILKARQLGFTTFIAILFLDSCLFASNLQAAMIAHRMESAKKIFATKVKYPYDNLSEQLKDSLPLKKAPSGRDQESMSEMQFDNGSGIQVDVSVRSGTYQLVHVSEYGYLSAYHPQRANEVKTGTLETAHQKALVFVESTAEGPVGEFYDMWETASSHNGPLGPFDYKPVFFAWFDNPEYTLDTRYAVVSQADEVYFASIAAWWKKNGREIHLTDQQKAWYASKAKALSQDIYKEHPSTPEEAFQASTVGTFWAANLNELRRRTPPQITNVPWDKSAPVYAFWDLGDVHTAILFAQFIGKEIHIIDSYEDNVGIGIPAYAKMIQSLSYLIPKDGHFAGPDLWGSNAKSMQTGKTTVALARENQIDFQKIEPHEVSDGIRDVQVILSVAWIDKTRCDIPLKMWQKYHKKLNESASTKDRPYYFDSEAEGPECHFSDALRHLARAYRWQTIGGEYIGDSRRIAAHFDRKAQGYPAVNRNPLDWLTGG